MRTVDRYGWLAALLLGAVACFRLAPNQSAAILRPAEFLVLGFTFAGIGEIVWHMITMRFGGSLGLYLGLRYFVIAAIFGAVIIVSPGESTEPPQSRPTSMVPILVIGGLLAIVCGAFWIALVRGKRRLGAALVCLGGVLSIAKASLTVLDQWRLHVPVAIYSAERPNAIPEVRTEPVPAAVSNAELKACKLGTVGPFRSCSVDIERPGQIRSIGENYLDGSKTWGSGLIVLVGSADNRRLNRTCMKQFGNNADLAHRRADVVLSGLEKWFPDHEERRNFTILVSGQRFIDIAKEERGKDRSVDAWVVWNWDGRGSKPNCQ